MSISLPKWPCRWRPQQPRCWRDQSSRRGGACAPKRPVALVGRDTRVSGEFLEQAVVAGLASAGVDALVLGVIPTPGVAYLTDIMGADFGVMLSASHNAMPDNGISFRGWRGQTARRGRRRNCGGDGRCAPATDR